MLEERLRGWKAMRKWKNWDIVRTGEKDVEGNNKAS